jgi:hypothetical protein
MSVEDNFLKSDRGSVRYHEGAFYTVTWQEVFIPLTNKEFVTFMSLVRKEEKLHNRPLSYAELVKLSEGVPDAE